MKEGISFEKAKHQLQEKPREAVKQVFLNAPLPKENPWHRPTVASFIETPVSVQAQDRNRSESWEVLLQSQTETLRLIQQQQKQMMSMLQRLIDVLIENKSPPAVLQAQEVECQQEQQPERVGMTTRQQSKNTSVAASKQALIGTDPHVPRLAAEVDVAATAGYGLTREQGEALKADLRRLGDRGRESFDKLEALSRACKG